MDRYELLGEIASGGMGTVLLGRLRRSMGFTRLVAVKCMHPQFAKMPEFASMFVDEARLAARLHHPNIVSTLDIISEDGRLLIVMDYVDGASAASLMRQLQTARATMPVEIACALIHDTLLGLHEAHEAKDESGNPLAIVHRDVSPQNVLVGLDGMARVLDFGIAKAHDQIHNTADNSIRGKMAYMAPEQIFPELGALDRRADIYAAGVVLWELLCGRQLFAGREDVIAARIREGTIPPPSTRSDDIPDALDEIVLKATAQNPSTRFPSALAMAEAIAAAVNLPHRTEIATWVKKWISPREIPTEPSSAIAAGSEQAAIQAVLERTTVIREPISDATETFAMTAAIATTTQQKKGRSPARSLGKFAAVALALMLATSAGFFARRHVPAAPAKVAAVEAQAPALPTPPTPSTPPSPTPPSTTVSTATTPPLPAVNARVPAASVPASRARHAASRPADPKAAACKVPDYYDANGRRRFKAECF